MDNRSLYIISLIFVFCSCDFNIGKSQEMAILKNEINNIDNILAETKYFEFHSNVLINMHHHLYQTARFIDKRKLEKPQDKLTLFFPDDLNVEKEITAKEVESILAALKYYQIELVKFDLMDSLMNSFRYEMMNIQQTSDLDFLKLPTDLVEILKPIISIFKKHLWSIQKTRNIEWVNERLEVIKSIEEECIEKLQKIYNSQFPWKKLRIDVCGNFTYWAGAYSTKHPYPAVVISSYRKNYKSFSGTEMIFHESAHTLSGVYKNIQPLIKLKCKENSKIEPKHLWHAILFYTSGIVAKEAFEKRNLISNYKIYMEANGVFAEFYVILQKYWHPYLEGEVDMSTALDNLVKKL